MKHLVLLIVTSWLILGEQVSAQNFLRNPGFESWTGNTPTGWSSDSAVSKSTIAHSGSYSAKLTNVSFFGIPLYGWLDQDSIPVSGSTFSLKGWYQFYPDSGDQVTIFVWIYGPQGIVGRLEGANTFVIGKKATAWTAFAVGVPLLQGAVGDTAAVYIWITEDTVSHSWHMGTYGLFDDFVLDNSVTGVKDNEFALPSNFSLAQNYPNPFNPSTQIEFTIPSMNHVTLKVYNVMGQEIAALLDENLERGRYKVPFDGSQLASGVYLYRIQAGNFTQSKKMLLVK